MELHKLDRSRFLHDPLDPELVAKLSKHKEFKADIKSLNRKKVVQYIVLMYDMNNDEVRAEWPFYPQRKYEIMKMVGLGTQAKIPKQIEDMMVGKNDAVNAMIIRYLSLFNNPDLIMLSSYYEIFIELNKQSYSGDFNSNTIKDIEKVNNSIKELTESIFGGKDETELRQELYKTIEEKSLGIRPEEIAGKIQKGESPLGKFNPYNSDALPDAIKFLGDK